MNRLVIKNLKARFGNKEILKGINLVIEQGKMYALMGPNGSGKSTLAQVLMGNPAYTVSETASVIKINEKNLSELKPDQRAREGIFLAFQNPVAVPGVTVSNLLRTVYQASHKNNPEKAGQAKHNPSLSVWEFNTFLMSEAKKLGISSDFLGRPLNDGFSGGEKKKAEMLQAAVLKPKFAIFDEIDTGLDVDALKTVALGIERLKQSNTGVIIITHYQRILKYARPDVVHVLVEGKIVDSGGYDVAKKIETDGYKKWLKKDN